MGGTFAGGGAFEVDGNGTGGLPNGVLFSGSFSGPVTWTLSTLANGTHNYTLTGVVTGTMGGSNVEGVTVQLTINPGKGFFNGSTSISGGDTTVASSVPEPSTLALFGMGSIAFAGALRERCSASSGKSQAVQNQKRPQSTRAFCFCGCASQLRSSNAVVK